jgi:hypothetical protein
MLISSVKRIYKLFQHVAFFDLGNFNQATKSAADQRFGMISPCAADAFFLD